MREVIIGGVTGEVVETLRAAFPGAAAREPLRVVDTGLGSVVVGSGADAIFRFARTAEAADGHRRELELLPRIAPRLPVRVPIPVW